jgi:DNA-binding NarL/FixJ family response regulator
MANPSSSDNRSLQPAEKAVIVTPTPTPPVSESGPHGSQPPATAIRVLVAAPYPAIRMGLAAIVTAVAGFQVAGEAADVESLALLAESLAPRVVLLDPGDDADGWLQGLWPLPGDLPGGLPRGQAFPPVVMLAGASEPPGEVLRSGVRGFLLRDAGSEEIALTLRAVAAGLVVLDHRIADALTEAAPASPPYRPEGDLPEALTAREREVLELIAQGMPNKTIAAELHISEHTVKFHVGSILAKLGASSRSEALARAARLGLIAL